MNSHCQFLFCNRLIVVTAIILVTVSTSIRAVGAQGFEVIALPPPFKGSTISEVRLPQILNNPRVPTDVTGPGGSLGHARGMRAQLIGPETEGARSDLRSIQRDHRYAFAGPWRPLATTSVAGAAYHQGRELIATRLSVPDSRETNEDLITPTTSFASVIPTKDSHYNVLSSNEVVLTSGAILIKPDTIATRVTCLPGKQNVTARIARGSIAMVSSIGDCITINALICDRHHGVTLFVAGAQGKHLKCL